MTWKPRFLTEEKHYHRIGRIVGVAGRVTEIGLMKRDAPRDVLIQVAGDYMEVEIPHSCQCAENLEELADALIDAACWLRSMQNERWNDVDPEP